MSSAGITISTGNRKIKNANIFNLPVGTTCKPGVLCSKYCYSKKAERAYPGVRPSRMANYRASKREDFVEWMVELLAASEFKVTRIHEGGDFYSKEYILKWYEIAKALPKHKFFAYTKRDDLFNKDLLDQKPVNLTLIYSIDGVFKDTDSLMTLRRGFHKFAIVREHKTNCPATSKDGWKKACVRDCKKCFDNETQIITFARH